MKYGFLFIISVAFSLISEGAHAWGYKEIKGNYERHMVKLRVDPGSVAEDVVTGNLVECKTLLGDEKTSEFRDSTLFNKREASEIVGELESSCRDYEGRYQQILVEKDKSSIEKIHKRMIAFLDEEPHETSHIRGIVSAREDMRKYDKYSEGWQANKMPAVDAYSEFMDDYSDAVAVKVSRIGGRLKDELEKEVPGSDAFNNKLEEFSEFIEWVESGSEVSRFKISTYELRESEADYYLDKKLAKCPEINGKAGMSASGQAREVLATERGVMYYRGTIGQIFCATVLRGVVPVYENRGTGVILKVKNNGEMVEIYFEKRSDGEALQMSKMKLNGRTDRLSGRQQAVMLQQLSSVPQM